MTYLFLAIPPFCGSTILHNYLRKCENVASLTNEFRKQHNWIDEESIVEGSVATSAKTSYGDRGTKLVRIIPGNFLSIVQDSTSYDWIQIRKAWNNNWASTKPNAPVRVQKTPNDAYRIKMMQPYFNAKWIISVREPYAYTQSIIEEILARNIDPSPLAENIARHVITTYIEQKKNVEFLGSNAYVATFEDIAENPQKHLDGLKTFVPELTDLSFTGTVKFKQTTADGYINTNAERVADLQKIPGAVEKFQHLYGQYPEIIEHWGYKATL